MSWLRGLPEHISAKEVKDIFRYVVDVVQGIGGERVESERGESVIEFAEDSELSSNLGVEREEEPAGSCCCGIFLKRRCSRKLNIAPLLTVT